MQNFENRDKIESKELDRDYKKGEKIMEELIVRTETKDDRIEVFKHGEDDYSVNFLNADFSLRGTLQDVIIQIIAFCNYKIATK